MVGQNLQPLARMEADATQQLCAIRLDVALVFTVGERSLYIELVVILLHMSSESQRALEICSTVDA